MAANPGLWNITPLAYVPLVALTVNIDQLLLAGVFQLLSGVFFPWRVLQLFDVLFHGL